MMSVSFTISLFFYWFVWSMGEYRIDIFIANCADNFH